MRVRKVSKLMTGLAVLALLACSGAAKDEEYGGVNVAMNASALTPSTPDAVYIHVYGTTSRGTAYDQLFQLFKDGSVWSIRIDKIPAGTYQIHGYGYLDPAAVPMVDPADWETVTNPDASFQVAPKGTTTANLRLQQMVPPLTVNNNAPTVDSLVASAYTIDSTAGAMEAVNLTASASDLDAADQGSLSYLWTSSSGGAFSNDVGLATTWTPAANTNGLVTLTFAVMDFQGARSAMSITFDVRPGNARGTLIVVVDINNWPDIIDISANSAQILPGGSANIVATTYDAENDAIAFTWSSTCGTFAPAIGTATYLDTPPAGFAGLQTVFTPSIALGACTLTLAIDDGRGGTNSGTFVVNVGPNPAIYGPEFVAATMAPSNPVPGNNITFQVAAVETLVNGTTVSPALYTWSSNIAGGSFSNRVVDGSRTVYTPPACTVPGSVNYVVTVTAQGSASPLNDTTFTFPFTVTCP